MPEALAETLADLRRSDDVVRLRLAGLSGEEVAEFVRRAAGGARRGVARARAGDQRPDRGQPLPGLRAVARAGRDRRSRADGAIRLTRPLAELGTPESVREVVSQRLARLRAGDDRPARAGGHGRRGVRARGRAPRRGPPSPSCSPALDEAVRSGMIEELPPAAGLPLHARAGPPGALRRLTRCGARSCTCASARRSSADGALGPRARRPRAPLRRRGAVRRRRARRRVQRARRAGGGAALAFDEAASGSARRARARDRRARRERAQAAARARRREPPRRSALDALEALPRGGRDRARARRRRAAGPGGDRLRGRLLAPGDHRPGRGRAARGGGGALGDEPSRAARRPARRAGPRARRSGRPRARRRRARRARSRWRGGSATAPRSRGCWSRSYWSRDDARSRRSSRC